MEQASGERGRPRAMLLDLDDTLLDNSGIPVAVERACRAIAAALDDVDPDRLRRANEAAWSAYWPQVEPRTCVGEIEVLDVVREVWRRALAACGHVEEAAVGLAFEIGEAAYREVCRPFPEAPAFIERLGELGLPIGLVTNGSVGAQTAKLRTLELDERLDTVVITGELGVAKPDPAPFLVALARLGAEPADAWHVGDSLTSDVGGARAAGLTAVWLNRRGAVPPNGAPRPDIEVTNLTEVLDRLP